MGCEFTRYLLIGNQQNSSSATDDFAQEIALASLTNTDLYKFIQEIALGLSKYDWRTSAMPGIAEDERKNKLIFRGSSGYKELRKELLLHLTKQDGDVAVSAKEVLDLVK